MVPNEQINTRKIALMKLLHIDSAITGEHSVTRQLTASVVDRIKTFAPGTEVTYRDVVADALPHVELHSLPGDATPDAVASAAVLEEFLAADTVVIGAPMYNFNISSQLKSWLDRILIAGKTFRYTAEGPVGLAGGKRVIVAVSRGGFYGAGQAAESLEHVETYLNGIFNLIGIQPEFVIAEGIAVGPEQREAALGQAHQIITAIAA